MVNMLEAGWKPLIRYPLGNSNELFLLRPFNFLL